MSDAHLTLARRHLRFGWLALWLFSGLGVVLELLHAFKIGFYLNVDSETRRLMWRLAHAHGSLLGLLNIAFAATLPHVSAPQRARLPLASACLIAGSLSLPMGFLLGGAFAGAADPGLPVLLVPPGALLLLLGIGLTARSLR
jgi:hypothetical protein